MENHISREAAVELLQKTLDAMKDCETKVLKESALWQGKQSLCLNRDPEQYKCTSVEEDIESLNKLLDQWICNSRPASRR